MFRQTIFWSHLIIGLLTGLFIALLCLTGAILAFEIQIIDFAERDSRAQPPSTTSDLLSPQALLTKPSAILARHFAQAMERATRHRETQRAAASEPHGPQSKTQRAKRSGAVRWTLHHGVILLRRLCRLASRAGCRSRGKAVSNNSVPLKSGEDTQDLIHTP